MIARLLLVWLVAAIIFLSSAAELPELSCPRETPWIVVGIDASTIGQRTTRTLGVDSVSLLQSRGIHVEFGDEGSSSLPSQQDVSPGVDQAALPSKILVPPEDAHQLLSQPILPKSDMLEVPQAISEQSSTSLSGWSILMAFFILAMPFLCVCLMLGFSRAKELDVESRVSSVLQHQKIAADEDPVPSKVSSTVGSQETLQPGGSPNSPLRFSPKTPLVNAWLSSQMSNLSGSKDDLSKSGWTPPQLSQSNPPLANEVLLQIPRDAAESPQPGKDIVLLEAGVRPFMRACLRKVDADMWLEVALHEPENGPSAMACLFSQASPRRPTVLSQTVNGPDIFGPDGNLYGTLEMKKGLLIHSDTGKTVLTINGDRKNFQAIARAPNGFELATVDSPASNVVNIHIQRGNDVALIVIVALAFLMTPPSNQ
jgi:hypothetical protein